MIPDPSAELERCDLEIAEILDRDDVRDGSAAAWLVARGMIDWETEKRLIEQEKNHEAAF